MSVDGSLRCITLHIYTDEALPDGYYFIYRAVPLSGQRGRLRSALSRAGWQLHTTSSKKASTLSSYAAETALSQAQTSSAQNGQNSSQTSMPNVCHSSSVSPKF